MTPADRIARLRALLARGCFLPDARALAEWMLARETRSIVPEGTIEPPTPRAIVPPAGSGSSAVLPACLPWRGQP